MAACGKVQIDDCEDCVQVVRDTKTVEVPCTRNTYEKYTIQVPRQVTEQIPRTVTYTDYESRQKRVPYTVKRSERRIRMQTEKYQVPVTKYYKKTVTETRERQVPIPFYGTAPEGNKLGVMVEIPAPKSKVGMDGMAKPVYDTQLRAPSNVGDISKPVYNTQMLAPSNMPKTVYDSQMRTDGNMTNAVYDTQIRTGDSMTNAGYGTQMQTDGNMTKTAYDMQIGSGGSVVNAVYDTQMRTNGIPQTKMETKQAPVYSEVPQAAPAPAQGYSEVPQAAPAPAQVYSEVPQSAPAPAQVYSEVPQPATACSCSSSSLQRGSKACSTSPARN